MLSIQFTYNIWWLVLCLIVGALSAFLLYFPVWKKGELSKGKLYSLFLLRFVVTFLIGFLFLRPFMVTEEKEYVKPKLILAHDVSGSAINALQSEDSLRIRDLTNLLEQKVQGKMDVVPFYFSDKGYPEKSEVTTDKVTDFQKLEESIDIHYAEENIGGVVLLTDGIATKGMDLNYNFNGNYPVFTVGLGDTTVYPDALIREVYYNDLVYQDNEFPVECIVEANNLKGQNIGLKIYHNDTLRLDTALSVTQNQQEFSVLNYFLAKQKTKEKIKVLLSTEAKELNTGNNEKAFFIETLSEKKDVLVLSAGVHPDESFFTEAISRDLQYKISRKTFDEVSTFIPYNIVVFSGIPENFKQYSDALSLAISQNKNVLLLPHNNENLARFNNLNIGVNVKRYRSNLNDVFPLLNDDFTLFNTSNEWKRVLKSAPPVKVPFTQLEVLQGTTFAFQKVGQVETDIPLIHFSKNNESSIGIFFGEGYWKWRMYAFQQTGNNESWKGFVRQLFRLLNVKEIKDRLVVSHKSVYQELAGIQLKAEFYNQTFEPVANQSILLILQGPQGELKKRFTPNANEYKVNLGALQAGNYNFEVKCEYGGEVFTKSGAFVVEANQLEYENTVANHSNMRKLSRRTNGVFVSIQDDPNQLADAIVNSNNIKTIIYTHKSEKPFNHFWELLVVIAICLSAEWWLRKYWGLR